MRTYTGPPIHDHSPMRDVRACRAATMAAARGRELDIVTAETLRYLHDLMAADARGVTYSQYVGQ